MRNYIYALFILLGTLCLNAKDVAPDFAYPQTVISDSRQKLEKSDRQGKDAALAMLEITVATLALESDSMFMLPAEINSLASKQKSAAVKSLLLLMEAQTLQAIYYRDRWKYDRTDTPDTPLPDNPAAWNGRQFKNSINSLVKQAYNLACSEPLPLKDFSNIVNADHIALMYYPTVRDFAALKATRLMLYDNSAEHSMAVNNIIEKELALTEEGSYCYINWLCTLVDESPMDNDIRFKRLLDLYGRFENHEAARQLLISYLNKFSCYDVTPAAIELIRQSLIKFPDYWNNSSLKSINADLLRPWVKVSVAPTAIPGRECKINLQYGNVTSKAGIIVYRTPDNGQQSADFRKAALTELSRCNIDPSDNLPHRSDTVFSFVPDAEVYYYFKPFIGEKIENKSWNVCQTLVSSLTPVLINGCSDNAIIVANSSDGKPVQGANVNIGSAKAAPVKMGKTDDEGILRFKLPENHKNYKNGQNYVYITNRGNKYMFGRRLHAYGLYDRQESSSSYNALVFTDRALYHQGDSISWATAVCLRNENEKEYKQASGHEVNVELHDANYELVADTVVETDIHGRACGVFTIPTGRLNGRFSIIVKNGKQQIGASSVEVSDFKLPSFFVENDTILRHKPQSGYITLKGRATTYSMMPVAGAEIQLTLRSASRARWFRPDILLGYLSASTDSHGRYEIEIPEELLKSSATSCYIADIMITANDGESRSTSVSFTTGKPYEIVCRPTAIDCADSVALPLNVYDANGNQVHANLKWWLKTAGVETANGTADAPGYKVDWGNIPSGEYTLSVACTDPQLSDTCSTTISLYNTELGTMPTQIPLFVPTDKMEFAHGHSGELSYGVPRDTYLYMALVVDNELVSIEGIETSAGFHTLKLTLPEGHEYGQLTMYTISDGMPFVRTISVSEKVDRRISIEGESFRDHVMPGDVEHWKLKLVTPESKKNISSAVIATAYNKALSALASLSWPSAFPTISGWMSYHYSLYASYNEFSNLSWRSMVGPISDNFTKISYSNPEFIYPISAYNLGMLRIRGSRAVKEESEDGTVTVTEVAYAKANTMMLTGAADNAAGASNNAEVTEEEIASDSDGTQSTGTTKNGFEYRPSEVLQALWMPGLSSDSDGNVAIEFTVPQANTTWTFQAFAWDERLNSGSFARDFVAQKPVMVSPNLPRFLRGGDSANVLATVFNNSGKADSIITIAEIFNPANGRIISQTRVSETVDASASAIISLPLIAPSDVSVIGYRIKSSLGKFTDGEQSLIPVLPATTEVMESDIFSLTANTVETNVKLPDNDKLNTVLEYCDNPAWDVIKALPALYGTGATTSWSAVRKLFRASASKGIMNADPQIAGTFAKAFDNQSDSSLVSELSKSEELKLATLQQTPWVRAAASQTERMARLKLLLDSKAATADIESAVKALEKLQNSDGGFSWADWMAGTSSDWATRNVLSTIGKLRTMGYTPDNKKLWNMVPKALRFVESQLEDRHTDFNLTWIYTLLPDYKPGMKAEKIINATVQQMISDWRNADVGRKAMVALMLERYGYRNVAKEILASITQFAQTQNDGSIFFPSLDDIDQYASVLSAFAKLEPEAPIIDGLRQWLVMRSQRADALGSCDPTELIAAFVNSGSHWTVPAELPRITIGNKSLDISATDNMTGHFIMSIDNIGEAHSLLISRRNPQTPAWGAVISRSSGRTDRIKAASCSQLSINKQISVLRDGKWQYADELNLGERVRVTLTLEAKDDLQYISLCDDRAAGLEPVDQLPGYVSSGGVSFYRDNADSATMLFIDRLPRGTYTIVYELTASMAGDYISGIASVQSQYAPSITAHSAGYRLKIND